MNRQLALLIVTALLLPYAVTAAAGNVPGTSIKYEAEYPDTRTTVYKTAECEVQGNEPIWCSPATEDGCITSESQIRNEYPSQGKCLSQDKGWCCIPPDDRGFYEEVRCQGSGACQGKTFHTSSISPEPMANPVRDEETGGETSSGVTPERQHTIATNDDPSSDCYLPVGSRVYIDFGPDSAWNGEYMSEDIGSAIDRRAESGNCKIDVYAGIGEDAKQSANEEAGRRSANVYILEWGDDSTEPVEPTTTERGSTSISKGFLNAKYRYHNTLPVMRDLARTTSNVKNALNQCNPQNAEKCAQDALKQYTTDQWQVSSTCNPKRSTADIATDKNVVTSGEVKTIGDVTVGSASTPATRTISLNTAEESFFETIVLRSQSLSKLDVTRGDSVAIYSERSLTRDTEFDIPTINLDASGELRTLRTSTDRLIAYVNKLGSCQTSDETCVCELDNELQSTITLSDKTASTPSLTQKSQSYFYTVEDGSSIPTGIQASLISQSGLDFRQITSSLNQIPDSESPVTVPASKTSYFLYSVPGQSQASGTLAKLSENPTWYRGDQTGQEYKQALTQAIQGIKAVNNPATIIGDQPDTIPTCQPKKVYQSVCVQQRPGSDYQPPISIPPVSFVQPIT